MFLGDGCLVLADFSPQLFARILGVAEQHVSVILEENWVLHTSVTSVSNGALQDKDILAIPHTQYRHAVDAAVGVILGRTAHSIGCTNHQGYIHV